MLRGRDGCMGWTANIQVRALLGIHDRGDGNAEIGDGTPEICIENMLVVIPVGTADCTGDPGQPLRGRPGKGSHWPSQSHFDGSKSEASRASGDAAPIQAQSHMWLRR